MLDAVTDGIRLQKLGTVEQLVEILRIQVGLGQIVADLAVGRCISLVHLHHAGINVAVFFFREAADRLQGRERLEAELGQETIVMLPVGGKGFTAVPDAPVVDVAHVLGVAVLVIAAGTGRGRPVKGHGIFFFHDPGDDIFVQPDIVEILFLRLGPCILFILRFHLVVAAPEADAGMGAEPADVLADLRGHVCLEGRRQLVGCAGEHEIVPDQKAALVAYIIEEIVQKIAAAPDTDAVEMGLLCGG